MWELKDLWFRYRNDLPWIIEQFSSPIRCGKFTAILGPNGSGKTTLLDLMAGILRPSQGEISFDHLPIHKWNPKQLSKKIALVPQDFSVRFAFTVRQVVEMGRFPFLGRLAGLCRKDHNIIDLVMEELDIAAMADRPVTTLSGGELQRVAVARALAQSPKALLLDEATSNLDIFHSLSIMSVIKRRVEQEGLTVVAAIHDINLAAAFCDCAIFVDKGKIRAAGPKDELFDGKLISRLYGVDAAVSPDAFSDGVQISFRLPRLSHRGQRP